MEREVRLDLTLSFYIDDERGDGQRLLGKKRFTSPKYVISPSWRLLLRKAQKAIRVQKAIFVSGQKHKIFGSSKKQDFWIDHAHKVGWSFFYENKKVNANALKDWDFPPDPIIQLKGLTVLKKRENHPRPHSEVCRKKALKRQQKRARRRIRKRIKKEFEKWNYCLTGV